MTHFFLPCKEKLESGTPETPVGVENTGVRGSSVDKALLTALLNWAVLKTPVCVGAALIKRC